MPPKKSNSPYNPASPLFKRLTRLFAGPIVDYRAQITRQERRNDLDKYRYKFRSLSGQEFKRSVDNLSKNYNVLSSHAMRAQNRNERYIDFDQMEYMPEIASAMDIYADEMTTSNDYEKLLKVDCLNQEIKIILEALFYDALNIEFNAFGWARSMCKYGDFYLYMDIDEQLGVKSVIGLPNNEIERLEGQDPTNPNYVQFQWNGAGMTFENWQVAHLRILGNDKNAPYGTSVLEPARRIWRQLVLIEDAMLAYRVVRAPERRVFKIDVGNIPPQDVEQYMEKVKTSMKRNQLVDATTGRVDLRYNPLSLEEDYFIPIRGGVGSDITSLQGAKNLNDIDDVKYMRDKLFSAIKIPQSYLTMGEGETEDKTTLAQKDIRFARTIQRLQRSILSEMEKIAVIHLYTLGFRGEDLVSFNLSLNNPSKLAEMQQLEYLKSKFDIAGGAPEGMYSKRWLSKNVLGMSDDEFLRNQRESFYDKKYQAALEAVGEAAAAEGGGMGGDLGGDLGGELGGDLGGEELGGELGGEEGEELGGEEGGEESALLATPGRKEDRRRRGQSGPRTRSTRRTVRGPEFSTHRRLKGHGAGGISMPDFRELVGLEEEKQSTYNGEEEKILLENTFAVRQLITQLESKEAEKDETQQET